MIKTSISVNGIWASTSGTASMDDPCKDHAANFGFSDGEGPQDFTEECYDALEAAWDERDDGEESVTICLYGDSITLALVD